SVSRERSPARTKVGKQSPQPHLQRAVVIPPSIFVDRDDERERAGESRGVSGEYPPFPQPLADETVSKMVQIPQTAVDEFCRAAGRAGGEIALFDQRDAQPAQRRVERQTGPGYP